MDRLTSDAITPSTSPHVRRYTFHAQAVVQEFWLMVCTAALERDLDFHDLLKYSVKILEKRCQVELGEEPPGAGELKLKPEPRGRTTRKGTSSKPK